MEGITPQGAGMVHFALLKTKAQHLGVEAVDRRGGALTIKFHPASKIAPERLMALVAGVAGAQFTPAGVLRLPLPPHSEKPTAVLEFVKEALDGLAPVGG